MWCEEILIGKTRQASWQAFNTLKGVFRCADFKLMETHATLPPYLTMRSLSLSITDGADLILRRYALEVCLQKSRCVLHRKYLIPGKSNPHVSLTPGIGSAMSMEF